MMIALVKDPCQRLLFKLLAKEEERERELFKRSLHTNKCESVIITPHH
jgi:hypothetical protein